MFTHLISTSIAINAPPALVRQVVRKRWRALTQMASCRYIHIFVLPLTQCYSHVP